jgi:hypothetical protein
MTAEMRDIFSKLPIDRPEKCFVNFPGMQVLYRDLRVYQRVALSQLAAKGIVNKSAMEGKLIFLNNSAIPSELMKRIQHANKEDEDLLNLITANLLSFELLGSKGIYNRTNLPRRII